MKMRIAIFDVGTRNFAMIVEEIKNKNIKDLKNQYESLPKSHKIKEGRPHTSSVQSLLSSFYSSGKTIALELFDPNKGESGLSNTTRSNLFHWLENKKELLISCNYIAIEEQFYDPKHGVINKPALLLGESCYSWILLNVTNNVSYTPSKLKTALLGCPKDSMMIDKQTGLRMLMKWEKKDRKKWSAEIATSIYKARGDKKMEEYINSRKKDDVSDCLLMVMAYILKEWII